MPRKTLRQTESLSIEPSVRVPDKWQVHLRTMLLLQLSGLFSPATAVILLVDIVDGEV